jgi:hypothetical protein
MRMAIALEDMSAQKVLGNQIPNSATNQETADPRLSQHMVTFFDPHYALNA